MLDEKSGDQQSHFDSSSAFIQYACCYLYTLSDWRLTKAKQYPMLWCLAPYIKLNSWVSIIFQSYSMACQEAFSRKKNALLMSPVLMASHAPVSLGKGLFILRQCLSLCHVSCLTPRCHFVASGPLLVFWKREQLQSLTFNPSHPLTVSPLRQLSLSKWLRLINRNLAVIVQSTWRYILLMSLNTVKWSYFRIWRKLTSKEVQPFITLVNVIALNLV